MQALLITICQALLGTFLDWGKAWVASEHAKADEWAAATLKGQLAASDRAKAVGDRIGQVVPAWDPKDEAEWNRGAAIIAPLLLACLLLQGCFTREVFVDGDWPIIAEVPRPVLVPGPAWTPTTHQLATYALALEARLAAYNQAAAKHNADAHAAAGGRP